MRGRRQKLQGQPLCERVHVHGVPQGLSRQEMQEQEVHQGWNLLYRSNEVTVRALKAPCEE